MLKYLIGGFAAATVFTGFGSFQNPLSMDILSPISAHANQSNKASSIDAVHFKRGKLVQTNKSKEIWTEYDSRGTERYEFKTFDYNSNALVLKGTQGNVRLVVDFKTNVISGEWPGHAMSPLYEVTRIDRTPITTKDKAVEDKTVTNKDIKDSSSPVEIDASVPRPSPNDMKDFSSSKDNQGPNDISVPAPTTVPPAKDFTSPDGKPVTAAQVPNPSILTVAKHEYGSFEKLEDVDWIEKAQSGRVFNYKKIGHNQRSVFLYDGSRSVMIEIDLQDNKIRSGVSGDGLRPLYDIIEAGNAPSTKSDEPVTSVNTGTKLSYLERTSCRLKGGKVERAGILGHERCTTSYKDGGDICIDSSNCEGLCIADLSISDNKEAVSGTCQLNDNPFGCYSEVVAGQSTPTLCVD